MCGGNGVVKGPTGVSGCTRCGGACLDPATPSPAEAQIRQLREALEFTRDWLESFSMPPTSAIAEKQEAIARIDAALAASTGQETPRQDPPPPPPNDHVKKGMG
jgi:hypothetical protein